METILIKMINMSISSSWMILFIFILRKIFKNIPKFMKFIMWAMVAIRLVCPVFFECPLCLVPSVETVSDQKEMLYLDSGVGFLDYIVNSILINGYVSSVQNGYEPNDINVLLIVSIIWFAICMIMDICYDVKQKKRKRNEENFKKVPEFFKGMGRAFAIVYWYNPVILLAYKVYSKDIDNEEIVVNDKKIFNYIAGSFACIILALCFLTNPQTVKAKDGDMYDLPYENVITYHGEKGNSSVSIDEKSGRFATFTSPRYSYCGYFVKTDDKLVLREDDNISILVFDIEGDKIILDKENSVYEFKYFMVSDKEAMQREKYDNGVYKDNYWRRATDCAIFDIDDDGDNERVFVGYGGTSGIRSAHISVMYKDDIEIYCEFLEWHGEGFEIIEGDLYVQVADEDKKYKVVYEDGNIIMLDGDERIEGKIMKVNKGSMVSKTNLE